MRKIASLGMGMMAAATTISTAACQREANPTPAQAEANAAAPNQAAPAPAQSAFAAMDADSDGQLTAAEHAASAARMFAMMDADHDGSVTATEMDQAQGKLGGSRKLSSADKIKAIDADGDGRLSDDEHAGGSQAMFVSMDKDRSGVVSQPEFDALHKAMLGS